MGFRKGKGTRDAVFQLRIISKKIIDMDTEKVKQRKKTKKKKPLYLCFVDYQKAFDRIKHD